MVKRMGNVNDTERRLIRSMSAAGLTWQKIGEITGRSPGTISKALHSGQAQKKVGAPGKITPQLFARMLAAMNRLQKKADGQAEVTVGMIKKAASVDASDRTVLRALRDHGISFRRLKERPILTKEDERSRLEWAKKRERRSSAQWLTMPHAIIDNKRFPLFVHRGGRDYAARRNVRGAYQKRGAQPKSFLVKPKKEMKFPAKGVTVTAAVINGRVRMWEYVEGNWNAEKAAAMYKGPLVKAMQKGFPHRSGNCKWTVLEDNDPAGYKARKALDAKREAGIVTDDLPRRSPDLNVLDYSLWHAINVKLRAQEAAFPKSKRESAEEYKKRLRATALRLPPTVVKAAVASMRRRVKLVKAQRGGLFKE